MQRDALRVGAEMERRFAGRPFGLQQLAQVRQRDAQVAGPAGGVVVGPQQVDGAVAAERAVDDEERQQRADPSPAQLRGCRRRCRRRPPVSGPRTEISSALGRHRGEVGEQLAGRSPGATDRRPARWRSSARAGSGTWSTSHSASRAPSGWRSPCRRAASSTDHGSGKAVNTWRDRVRPVGTGRPARRSTSHRLVVLICSWVGPMAAPSQRRRTVGIEHVDEGQEASQVLVEDRAVGVGGDHVGDDAAGGGLVVIDDGAQGAGHRLEHGVSGVDRRRLRRDTGPRPAGGPRRADPSTPAWSPRRCGGRTRRAR